MDHERFWVSVLVISLSTIMTRMVSFREIHKAEFINGHPFKTSVLYSICNTQNKTLLKYVEQFYMWQPSQNAFYISKTYLNFKISF